MKCNQIRKLFIDNVELLTNKLLEHKNILIFVDII
jgi:hypothetical protein